MQNYLDMLAEVINSHGRLSNRKIKIFIDTTVRMCCDQGHLRIINRILDFFKVEYPFAIDQIKKLKRHRARIRSGRRLVWKNSKSKINRKIMRKAPKKKPHCVICLEDYDKHFTLRCPHQHYVHYRCSMKLPIENRERCLCCFKQLEG